MKPQEPARKSHNKPQDDGSKDHQPNNGTNKDFQGQAVFTSLAVGEESPTRIPTQFLLQTTAKKSWGRPKKTGTQLPTNHPQPDASTLPTLPHYWCDCTEIYPNTSEIAEALQDPGKRHMKLANGSHQPVTSYPQIQKLCTKTYQKTQALYNPEGLTKNVTRGRNSLAGLVIMSRKLTDAMNLDVFFHQYAKNGQVYTITNNPTQCGLDIPLKEFQATILYQIQKAGTSRTCNDGLRLALTMLDPKYRDSVSIIITNRKDRAHSDISGDHVVNFFEKGLVDLFKNQDYKPPQPGEDVLGDIDVEELSQRDPTDPKIFDVDRTATWLAETWKLYVKRKYKGGTRPLEQGHWWW